MIWSNTATAQESVTLEPTDFGIRTAASVHRTGPCFGLDTRGIGSRLGSILARGRSADLLLVGYWNTVRKGADPAPCDHWNLDIIQPSVKFDLSEIPVTSSVTRAVLSWGAASVSPPAPTSTSGSPSRVCAGGSFTVGASRIAWPTGVEFTSVSPDCPSNSRIACSSRNQAFDRAFRSSRFNRRPPPRATNPAILAETIRVNVNNIVRGWVLAPSINHGFTFTPVRPPAMREITPSVDLTDGRRHQHCLAAVLEPRLTVEFRRWD